MSNEKLTPSQKKKLDYFTNRGEVIEHYITKGGYLALRLKRHSKQYPTGLYLFGPRGGLIDSKLFNPDESKLNLDF